MIYKKEEITKSFFENVSFSFLKRNLPMIISVSGENYPEFIKDFQKPYDPIFISAMQKTLLQLCERIPGCIFGYTEAFDLTLVIMPPANIESTSWYSLDTQRIVSLAASITAMEFNRTFEKSAKSYVLGGNNFDETKKINAMQGYVNAIDKGAVFSAKCFNLSPDEIYKYIYARQKESIGISVKAAARTFFKENELVGKSSSDIQFMIFDKAGINFDDYPAAFKHGSACLKNYSIDGSLFSELHPENAWVIDKEMPMLRDDNKEYVNRLL